MTPITAGLSGTYTKENDMKIANQIKYNVDDTVNIKALLRPRIHELIELVNQAYETSAIDYWVDEVQNVRKMTLDGNWLPDFKWCHSFDVKNADYSDDWFTIDVNTITRGAELILSGRVNVNPDLRTQILVGIVGADGMDVDAVDVLIQAGTFSKIVFG